MNTLYWHDYETFGVNPARDKPCQFAGIRTDEDLQIIGEPLVQYCKPPMDSLPAPAACLVTGISPFTAAEEGLPEPEFIHRIHQEMSRPGTCSVGYNNIRFDDEVTRYALYRNFYDPYEREWKNGNSRWDIINMVRLTRALRPEGIEWPDYEDGTPNFRLESLTRANGIGHESAHDALSDVLATIELARLIKRQQPKLYEYVYGHRSKQKVAEMVNVYQPRPFLHVSPRLPAANGYSSIMLPVAVHPRNSNAIICVNLMGEVEALINWSSEKIKERLFTPASELEEGESRIPLKAVHLNKCPVVATVKLLDSRAAENLAIDIERCEQNWQLIKQQNLGAKIASVFADEFVPEFDDPEQSLYQGFLPNSDKPLLAEVRNMPGEELSQSPPRFQDARYQKLLFLYRARYFNNTLNEDEQLIWHDHRCARILKGADGFQSLAEFDRELEALLQQSANDERARKILLELREWGRQLAAGLKETPE